MWLEQAKQEAWERAQKRIRLLQYSQNYAKYQNDPVGFLENETGAYLTDELCEIANSVRDNPVTVVRSGNDLGKCVAWDERIILADGRVIRAHDLIGRAFVIPSFDSDDKEWEQSFQVAWASDNGVKPVYRVTTDKGREVVRTYNHPLMTARKTGGRVGKRFEKIGIEEIGWKPVCEIVSGDLVAVPIQTIVEGQRPRSEYEIKIAAYLLGDGGLTSGRITFTQLDGKVKDEFTEIALAFDCNVVKTGKYGLAASNKSGLPFAVGSNTLVNLARQWGMLYKKSRDKTFPDWVWELPNDQLALFLNRLFACDGWAYAGGYKNHENNQIGISLASEEMIREIEIAMLRLGICGKVRSRMVKLDGKKFPAWEWSIHDSKNVLRFADIVGIYGKEEAIDRCVAQALKRNKSNNIQWRYQNIPDGYEWETVENVEYLGEEPTVTISVSNTHTFLTTFVEHNSFSAARLMIWFFSVFDDAKVFATAAPPLENLKTILWGEIGSVVSQKPTIFTGMKVKSLAIFRHANSFVKGIAIPISGTSEEREAKFSGKHSAHMFFVVDEGDAVPEEVYKGIESCMSGGHVRLLIMFNPRSTSGTVYNMERRKQANIIELNAFHHPNVTSGEDRIPGAVSRDVTIRRINEWTREMQEGEKEGMDDTFEVPDFLVGKTAQALDGTLYQPLPPSKRKITKPEFSYMVLGRYPSQSSWQLISEMWIEAAVQRWTDYVNRYGETPPSDVAPIMGCDLAEYGSDYNTACFRYGNYIEKLILWSGVDTDMSAEKALSLYIQKSAKIAMIDSTGIGSNVAPAMARRGRDQDVRAVSVKASEKPSPLIRCDFGEFYMLRDQLWWALRLWLEKEEAMIPPDGLLMEELRAVEYSFTTIGRKIKVTDKDELRKRLKRSTDRSDALCLTFSPFERAQWVSVEEAKRTLRAHADYREKTAENSNLNSPLPASTTR